MHNFNPGNDPEQTALPSQRLNSHCRLRCLSAAILSLPAMAGAHSLPPLILAYPSIGFYTLSVDPPKHAEGSHAVAEARLRPSPAQSRVVLAGRAAHPAENASAPEVGALKPFTGKAKKPAASTRPQVVVARRVTHAPKRPLLPGTVALHPWKVKANHRPAAKRLRLPRECPVDALPIASPVLAKVAGKSRERIEHRVDGAEPTRTATTHRVTHARKIASAVDPIAVKHPAAKASHRPAAHRSGADVARRLAAAPAATARHDAIVGEQPASGQTHVRVAIALRMNAASEPTSSARAAVACDACAVAQVDAPSQRVALPESSPSDASFVSRTGRGDALASRASSGPSADDNGADASAPQLMVPPPPPDPQDTQLRSFRFVPGQKTIDTVPRPPAQQKLIQLNQDGNYAALATQGRALLKKEKVDDQLKFIIANAMAWTGQLHGAEALYDSLLNGPMALDAKVALANIVRWHGKNYLAVPMYRSVLAADPANEEAIRGLALSEEAMRPRTQLAVDNTHDSDEVSTRLVTLKHEWQTNDGLRTWGVQVNQMSDSQSLLVAQPQTAPTAEVPNPAAVPPVFLQRHASQATIVVRHQELDKPFQPAVELELGDRLYGNLTITPTALPVQVTVGKVNWGQMSLNPIGLGKRLSAVDVGVRGSFDLPVGNLSVAADNYTVSDNNGVQTGTLRFSPAFHLPLNLKPVVGLEYRKSDFNTSSYWSPAAGYGLGYVGLEGQWSGKSDRWTVSASLQHGWGFYGEAKRSWGGTVSGRYVISRNWTLGASIWSIINSRNDAPYRARSGIVFLERSW